MASESHTTGSAVSATALPGSAPTPALFVSRGSFLKTRGGGVQWCTREYLLTLQAAGFALNEIKYESTGSLFRRLWAKLHLRPFDHLPVRNVVAATKVEAMRTGSRWCFLNNSESAALAPAFRAAFPGLKLVFLSHGAELTDVVNNLQHSRGCMPAAQLRPSWLGRLLTREVEVRRSLDATICISETDAYFERWLGSDRILFQPRQVADRRLKFDAVRGRVGCVATLNHGPNLHGLHLIAAALDMYTEIELRVVGGPESIGRDLERRHRSIHYLGRLDDDTLEAEAASWRAFVNPIFCPARGASTKVATALGWGLPVLTTRHGIRGFVWPSGSLPFADSPAGLAALVHHAAMAPDPSSLFAAVESVRTAAPSRFDAARVLREFLNTLPT